MQVQWAEKLKKAGNDYFVEAQRQAKIPEEARKCFVNAKDKFGKKIKCKIISCAHY